MYSKLKEALEMAVAHKRIYLFGMDGMREVMMDVVVKGDRNREKIAAIKQYL